MHSRSPARRLRAFTLVELLVVIAIIGILVALLLPAVQAAREAARRMSCGNNLKQLALSLHNYHDVNKALPPGGIALGACCTSQSYANWAIAILPYMEQQTLHDKYNFNVFNEDPLNAFVRMQILETHQCPSDINLKATAEPDSGPADTLNIQYAPSSYKGVAGRSRMHANWPDNGPEIYNDGGFAYRNRGPLHHVGTTNSSGTMKPTPESLATITDGTSNTLIIGEYHTKTNNRRRAFWAYTYTSYALSTVCPECGPRTLIASYDKCRTTTPCGGGDCDNPCKRAWGSFHPGVIQWALADGSVRPISIVTNIFLLGDLATINGGEAVQVP